MSVFWLPPCSTLKVKVYNNRTAHYWPLWVFYQLISYAQAHSFLPSLPLQRVLSKLKGNCLFADMYVCACLSASVIMRVLVPIRPRLIECAAARRLIYPPANIKRKTLACSSLKDFVHRLFFFCVCLRLHSIVYRCGMLSDSIRCGSPPPPLPSTEWISTSTGLSFKKNPFSLPLWQKLNYSERGGDSGMTRETVDVE